MSKIKAWDDGRQGIGGCRSAFLSGASFGTNRASGSGRRRVFPFPPMLPSPFWLALLPLALVYLAVAGLALLGARARSTAHP